MIYFKELEQILLKFIWKHKTPQIVKAVLRRKKKEDARYYFPTFNCTIKIIVLKIIKMAWNLNKAKLADQQNIIERSELPSDIWQLVYDIRAKYLKGVKKVFLTDG